MKVQYFEMWMTEVVQRQRLKMLDRGCAVEMGIWGASASISDFCDAASAERDQ